MALWMVVPSKVMWMMNLSHETENTHAERWGSGACGGGVLQYAAAVTRHLFTARLVATSTNDMHFSSQAFGRHTPENDNRFFLCRISSFYTQKYCFSMPETRLLNDHCLYRYRLLCRLAHPTLMMRCFNPFEILAW